MSDNTIIGLHPTETDILRAEVNFSPHGIEVTSLTHCETDASDEERVVSIAGSDVISRRYELPHVDAARTLQMVANRLEADLPIPIDEMTWDYRKSTKPAEATPVQAARTERVKALTNRFTGAAVTTDLEAANAIYRHAIDNTAAEATEVLIIASLQRWLLAVAVNGSVRSVRAVDIGEASIELASRNARQVIEADVAFKEIKGVLWCATDEVEISADNIAQHMDVNVEPVRVSQRLTNNDGSTLDATQLAEFAIPIGIALAYRFERETMICLERARSKDEPSADDATTRALSHPVRWTAGACAAILLALLIYLGSMSSENANMKDLLDSTDHETLPMNAIKSKVAAMIRLRTYRIDIEEIIASLCPHVPDKMILSSIQVSRGRRFAIKGTSSDPKAIYTLVEAIQKSPDFDNVHAERTEIARGGAFTITADVIAVKKFPLSSAGGAKWR